MARSERPGQDSGALATARPDALPATDRATHGRIVVVGQAARDLVLRVGKLPEAEGSATVTDRIERLGGKGANLAVGLRQLNPSTRVTLIAALGADASGDHAFADAVGSGLDVAQVVRRGRTALLVDLVDGDGHRRLLEDVPAEAQLSAADVEAATDAIRSADTVVLQLQQPAEALLAAAHAARDAGARLVLDGAIEGGVEGELLAGASIVRADAHETFLLTGIEIGGQRDARRAAEALLERGPGFVAVSVPGEGDLVAWRGGDRFLPFAEHDETDRTGAGDAFVAGLVTGLRRGDEPDVAGRLAADAAASTVQRLGGRPDLGHLVGAARDTPAPETSSPPAPADTTPPEETRDA